MEYVELHARSAFNFLRGALPPKAMVRAFREFGIGAAAMPDRNGVYGAPDFQFAAEELGFEALISAELTLARGLEHTWLSGDYLGHLPVFVENRTGYQNLCRLLTRMHLRWRKQSGPLPGESDAYPAADLAELAAHSEGLIATTGDREGPLACAWRAGGARALEAAMDVLCAVFPKDRIYVEIQRHLVRSERPYNRALVALAEHKGVPLLATNGPAYASSTGRAVLDVFTCLRYHTTLDRAGRLLEANTEQCIKSPAAMRALFEDLPQAVDNTVRLAARLQFRLRDLGYHFPKYPVPTGETMNSFLRKLTLFGAQNRYGSISRKVRRQLEHELKIIEKLGFAGYFLIVWDITNFCTERGILCQGRGSAANSAVCYSLGITAVDPIAGGLLFERFLSEGRKGWPDIDIDLPSGAQREAVIQEVYQRYGKHSAAMTANVNHYRGRSAMREIGKVLGLPLDVVERFNALFSRGDFPHTLKMMDQIKQAGLDWENPRHQAALQVFKATTGLPRNLGQHSGGMVICNDALNQIVPLENASMEGRVVLQWNKDACEDLGMVKIDLLGLGMMAVMQECIELTHERGRGVDLACIDKTDTETYDLLCRAETIGVFQVESRAQMATLPRMQPRCFYDLAIEVAIIRPGPISGDLANPYLNRRNGIEPVTYLDERLKPILERTLGIPMFQEQVLKMGIVMAGLNASESEQLRRALGFTRDEERVNAAKATLRARLQQRGIEGEKADWIVNTIDSFALYGFPESHAVSFALIAYASAWMKVHRTEEFFCALLNNQPMGFYGPATLIQDARRYGLRFLPPDVTRSEWDCTIEDDEGAACIRIGLKMINGLGQPAVVAMLEARAVRPFETLAQFRLGTQFKQDELRVLAQAGALNGFMASRRQALWAVEQPLELDLFSVAELEQQVAEDPVPYNRRAAPLPEMTQWERLCADFATTSVTVGSHPMRQMRPQLRGRTWTAESLNTARDGQRVTVVGAVICRQRPGTAKGVLFLSLEDETGIINCVLWPKLFERNRLLVAQEPYLRVVGKLQKAQGTIHVIARTVERLRFEDAPASASHDFH
ncbi:DNA polymerase III, alpha subunit [Coraliomargarita akajimensis DSM 45221]|uniref:Error-prone DNA polymerase n=2 Tax=Coraliomargarita TaxID=442430 RepID=D5EL55_CORAD|nr:DNA polymerase III, alpha subunit [Coraliomargarita akajimensis DSM 45221]